MCLLEYISSDHVNNVNKTFESTLNLIPSISPLQVFNTVNAIMFTIQMNIFHKDMLQRYWFNQYRVNQIIASATITSTVKNTSAIMVFVYCPY